MFDDVLIESAGKDKKKGGWKTALISGFLHMVIIGAVVAAGYYVKKNPEVITKPIQAFVVSAPPPPPPPPPPASSASSTPHVQQVETPKTQPTFHQPTTTPREVPQVDVPTDTTGGQEGGVVGGQAGGVVGGVVGGVIGGTLGGTLGGQLGGQIGGQGDKPMRVGGDVNAPTATRRVEPIYTDAALKAKIEGIVIVETIIDRDGNVTDVRVLKGLPLGLDRAAIDAVKRWKFTPGTLNGQPIPVIFTLTVNFQVAKR
ncbi:MAG: periplasmic protein TonB [Thermoanaerobaculia bacterium]|jgi:protein TonB|nr:periplasmic protein TonB [Thermoanaerobaculia bacterium]